MKKLWKLEDKPEGFTFKQTEDGLTWEEVKEPIIRFYKERLEWIEPLSEEEWEEFYSIKE